MSARAASVPGKLMLLGEYAVLEGAPALVAAVDRRARGSLAVPGRDEPGRPPSLASGSLRADACGPAVPGRGEPGEAPSPVVQAVLARVGVALEGTLRIDTSAFRDASGAKLGLGSSAAAALLAAALARGTGDERTLELAVAGHRDAAGGEGSGVDLAACFHGGVIATTRQPAPVEPLASRVRGLELSVLFTGRSADTGELVKAVRASQRWPSWSVVLSRLAGEGLAAWRAGDGARWLSVVARYARAMQSMGREVGAPIVTETLEAIQRWAEEGGGAAKPSGAGGGDVAVGWARDGELFARIAEKSGASLLELKIDPRGLVLESAA